MKRKVVKQLKKFLCRGMATLFLILPCMPVGVYADEITSSSTLTTAYSIEELLEMDDSACLAALLQEGLVLPEVYAQNLEHTATLVKKLLTDIQVHHVSPNNLPYSYTYLAELSTRIYMLVEPNSYDLLVSPGYYVMVDSTPIGSWSNNYLYYNCYAYALRRSDKAINPGYFSGESFNMDMTVQQMAEVVRKDLDTLGYYSRKTTVKPSSIESYESIICIRKSSDGEDYHFMRGNSALTTWNHKPGQSQPLRWKYTTPSYKNWTNEMSRGNVSIAPTHTYTGTICYIIYYSKSGPGPSPQSIENPIES